MRKIFEEDVEQDLPDRLQRLLEALDGATSDTDDEDPGDDNENGGGGAGGSHGGGASGNGGARGGEWADAQQVALTWVDAALCARSRQAVARAGPG